ncbi:MAG TPA: SpoIVB peptidase S55 domain-containing protein [Terriglobales bacterium]|nr:SpoIVB peptidase S55 domain-containing protein [Terriglobales bacterium]
MFRRVILSCLSAAFLLAPAPIVAVEAQYNVDVFPESEVRAGLHGVAYTVFEGTKPEPVDVEILGVLKGMAGPKSDVILARLHGERVEFTGVVAGMSGSPVYIDGKLVGALAYKIGAFSKEPIAGITPAAYMFEINDFDNAPTSSSAATRANPAVAASRTSTPNGATADAPTSGYVNLLQPIETPLTFSGFSEDTLGLFADRFASSGLVPVMGAGSVSDTRQPEALQPGSAVSAVLVRGDMNIAATCTVTYVDATRLLACGHPLLQSGKVDIPMTKATVLATLPSSMNSFKIVNATEPVGAFVQDRRSGIMGRFGQQPDMIPVVLNVGGTTHPKQFRFEVLNNPKITPTAIMATVFNALEGMNEYGEDTTYRLNGSIDVQGYPDVDVQNMYAPNDSAVPTAMAIATSIGERFTRIYENPYDTPRIAGVRLNFELLPERRSARLESARTDITEARPGQTISIEAMLRPYRGESMVQQIPVTIPASTPKGTLRILVSDGESLDRVKRVPPAISRKLALGSTIALLNKEHSNTRVYVSLMEPNPQAMVSDNVMPTLPLSVINVMDGMRSTQEMFVVGESATSEASVPVDYVVSGAQVITLNIR